MSAESRKQKRELRKFNRKERKLAYAKFLEAIIVYKDLNLKEKLPYKEKFKQVWPAIKPTLEFAVIHKFTGEKFDMSARQVLSFGDRLYGSEITDEQALELLTILSGIWENIESVLEIVKVITDDNTDVVIDKVIEIGEWLFEGSE
jgi:hypothetical protein